jgi:hypothetical protein
VVPEDFVSFPANAIALITQADIAPLAAMTLTMFKNGAPDATINNVPILPGGIGIPQLFQFTPGSVYAPGDLVTFEVNVTTILGGSSGSFADVRVKYTA